VSIKNNPEGGDMSGTYTESDLEAAITAAVEEALAPFQEEAALEALAKAFADAETPLKERIAELELALDTATLRAEKAEGDHTALVSYLEELKAQADAEAALVALRDSRREAVKDLGFNDDYIAERLDKWVALDEESFSELLDGWKAVASKKVETESTTDTASVPTTTAMKASREDGVDKFAAIREVSRLGLRGVDIRTL
jgi:hypothetical protein